MEKGTLLYAESMVPPLLSVIHDEVTPPAASRTSTKGGLLLLRYPYLELHKKLVVEDEEEAQGVRALLAFIEKKCHLTPELAFPILHAGDTLEIGDCVDACLLYILDNKETFDQDFLRSYFATHVRFGTPFVEAAFAEERPFLDAIAVENELQAAASLNSSEQD